MQKILVLASILVISLMVPGWAQQQITCPQDEEWSYSLTPYIWLSSLSGDAVIQGTPVDVDISFGDVVGKIDFGFEFHFEAHKNNWGYFVDPTYFKLSEDTTIDNAPASAKFTEWLVEFGGVYNIPLQPRKPNCLPQTLYVLFGGRYWHLSNDLTSDETTLSGSQSWVDPIIGLRYTTYLNDRWSFLGRFDIGGFGVGSHFSWNTIVTFGYDTSENQTALIGYRALGVDRENGSGDDLFEWDVTYFGPEIGYQFRW